MYNEDVQASDRSPSVAAAPSDRLRADRLLTIAEVSDYLAVPKATIYTWRARRPGFGPPAVKIGGLLRFRRSDVDAWLDGLEDSFDRDGQQGQSGASLRGRAEPERTQIVRNRRSTPRERRGG